MKTRLKLQIGIGAFVLAGAIAIAAVKVGSLQGSLPEQSRARAAPEFTGISTWLNSAPLTISQLRGKVVWIDFWTYSCINCIRTLPSVREFYARYHQAGLEIVGVHSPEFSFEKSVSNIRAAIARYRLPYPVAVDNDMATWTAYRNNSWPHVYLVDRNGKIAYDYSGEGGDEDLQTHLRALLAETGATLPPLIDFGAFTFNPHQTPEIYAGYDRGQLEGSLANREGYVPGQTVDYQPVSSATLKNAGTNGVFFLEGKWFNGGEFVRADEDGARIELPFFAQNVFVVAAPAGAKATATLLLDGKPVPQALLGEDATGGTIVVSRDDLFRALRLSEANVHRLTLTVSKGFSLYTFTFG
ncbi:MAG: redoxin domain-containing protein [Actinomycetota bacterium]